MTDTNNAAAIDQRLALFAERLRKAIAGEHDSVTDHAVAEVAAGWLEPWRYDLRTERLEVVLAEGLRLVDDMQEAVYASLPQSVRDADAAAAAAARTKWEARAIEHV